MNIHMLLNRGLLPQVRMNFLLKRSMSVVFLLCWIFVDSFNLVSCYMLNQLFTQQILNIIFVAFDVVLVFHHFFYLNAKNQSESLSTKFRVAESLVQLSSRFPGGHCGEKHPLGRVLQPLRSGPTRDDVFVVQDPKELSSKTAQYIVGNVIAYGSITLYLATRLHEYQIMKNYKRIGEKSAVKREIGGWTERNRHVFHHGDRQHRPARVSVHHEPEHVVPDSEDSINSRLRASGLVRYHHRRAVVHLRQNGQVQMYQKRSPRVTPTE
ncbi:Seven_transmembrane protein 1 [Hexamita inflata]|uniref:Seven_transmembrane protein 1 n=1 Tax=Hexamita inflata TaxID=28002 RepID=A0ABP1JQ76_9EUKA